MKYARLTKEQFESLTEEFTTFLATQSITASEWKKIKTNTPEVAEQELDIFSDLIWEGVLGKALYIENTSPQQLFLFKLNKENMSLILIKSSNLSIDITSENGFQWLQQNITNDVVEVFTASKVYSEDKKEDIFKLIQQGAVITQGKLFNSFSLLLKK